MAKAPTPVAASTYRLLRFLTCFALSLIVVLVIATCYYLQRLYPRRYRVYDCGIVNEFHHDMNAYTQGLAYGGNDTLYESTGIYGQSTARMVDLQTGKVMQSHQMDSGSFGGGITLIDKRLLQAMWLTTIILIYDKETLALVGKFENTMSTGVGLATDGESLIANDGTHTLYFMNPFTFAEKRRLILKDMGTKTDLLTDMEYVKDEIWATVFTSKCIARISPTNGKVLGWILLQELWNNLSTFGYKDIKSSSGIAWDAVQDRVFVTGMYWPKLYEIKVHPRPKLLTWESIQNTCTTS